MIKIYRAKKVITMNPAQPLATHIAVKDGRILGAGALGELESWGPHQIDDRFADMIIMPGMVEGHCHAMEGTFWRYTYCGYFDRMDPSGNMWSGATTIEAVIDRLKEVERSLDDPETPLPGWSLDPIYFDNERVSRQDLDQVSATRPIGIMHASGHIMNVNTIGLERAGLLRTGINHPGIPLGSDGKPTGELKGPDAMSIAGEHVGFDRDMLGCDEAGLINFGRACVRAGVTTATDLAAQLSDEAVDMMVRVTASADFPARICALRFHHGISPQELIDHALRLKRRSSDRLRLGMIKVVVDGSIQGFSARVRWPGYYNGAENGLWYIAPEQLREIIDGALRYDLHVHAHTNGDEATQLVLDCMEEGLNKRPVTDHRFTLQHCQLADAAQFRRMAKLGMCVNLFANHHFYWGDEHYKVTVGPERALRMNACRTALDNRIPMAIHSDAPITPLAPLFTAWCAINRLTASGRVQGSHERIGLDEALYAITLGAAYTLKLDHEIGSIETGKRADFAILLDDPYELGADNLKDARVWGTVQADRVFPVAG